MTIYWLSIPGLNPPCWSFYLNDSRLVSNGDLLAISTSTGEAVKTWLNPSEKGEPQDLTPQELKMKQMFAKDLLRDFDSESDEDEWYYDVQLAHLQELGSITIDKRKRFIVWGWNR